MRSQESMILLEALLRTIVQTNHMPRPDRDEIPTSLSLRVKSTSLGLWAQRARTASSSETEDIITVTSDDINWSRGRRCSFQTTFDGQQLAETNRVHVGEVELEDAFVIGARLTPEVTAAARHGGSGEVSWVAAGEAGGVEDVSGNGNGLGEIDGHGDAADAVACQDEGGNVAGVIGGLGVAEDRTIGVTDEDDAVEGAVCETLSGMVALWRESKRLTWYGGAGLQR